VLAHASAVASPHSGPLLLAPARTVIAFVQDPDGYKIELIQRK
jgi:catechol 2,3-dioxygenase-like lactoylglutathione lyase family enzyme